MGMTVLTRGRKKKLLCNTIIVAMVVLQCNSQLVWGTHSRGLHLPRLLRKEKDNEQCWFDSPNQYTLRIYTCVSFSGFFGSCLMLRQEAVDSEKEKLMELRSSVSSVSTQSINLILQQVNLSRFSLASRELNQIRTLSHMTCACLPIH